MSQLVCMIPQPGGAGLFQTSLQHMAMSAFNHSRTNWQGQPNGGGVVQAFQAVGQIAMGVAHWGLLFGCALRFQMLGQAVDDPLHRSTLQTLLLDAPPLIRSSWSAARCRSAEILADVVEIAKKRGLLAEDFTALQTNPVGTVSHGVNVALQTPACLPGDVTPPSPRFGYAAEGRSVSRDCAALGLGCHQPHLFPTARTFARPRAGGHSANHSPVSLCYHMGLPHGGQHPKRLLVLRFQQLPGPLGMMKRNRHAPHWLPPQNHNVPPRSGRRVQRTVRNRSRSTLAVDEANARPAPSPTAAAAAECKCRLPSRQIRSFTLTHPNTQHQFSVFFYDSAPPDFVP